MTIHLTDDELTNLVKFHIDTSNQYERGLFYDVNQVFIWLLTSHENISKLSYLNSDELINSSSRELLSFFKKEYPPFMMTDDDKKFLQDMLQYKWVVKKENLDFSYTKIYSSRFNKSIKLEVVGDHQLIPNNYEFYIQRIHDGVYTAHDRNIYLYSSISFKEINFIINKIPIFIEKAFVGESLLANENIKNLIAGVNWKQSHGMYENETLTKLHDNYCRG